MLKEETKKLKYEAPIAIDLGEAKKGCGLDDTCSPSGATAMITCTTNGGTANTTCYPSGGGT